MHGEFLNFIKAKDHMFLRLFEQQQGTTMFSKIFLEDCKHLILFQEDPII